VQFDQRENRQMMSHRGAVNAVREIHVARGRLLVVGAVVAIDVGAPTPNPRQRVATRPAR
jgi:hypothetical protein